MENIYKYLVCFILVIAVSSGCASSSYHIEQTGGGFSVTKLAPNTYELRNQSNTVTTQREISLYILRRCAQMTLEQGNRYFIISSQAHSYTKGTDGSLSFGQVIFKILPNKEQQTYDPILDAITIVKETDAVADGKLSDKARQTYNRLMQGEGENVK